VKSEEGESWWKWVIRMGACFSSEGEAAGGDKPKKKVPKGYTRFKMDEEPQRTDGEGGGGGSGGPPPVEGN